MDKIINVAVVSVVGFFGYRFYKDWRVEKTQKNEEKKLGSSFEGQQAMQIKAALNPTGFSFMRWGDGTNLTSLYSVARNISDFGKVTEAYRNLYDNSLAEALTNELNTNELTTFYKIINSKNPAFARFIPKFRTGESVRTNIEKALLWTLENGKFEIKTRLFSKGTLLKVGKGSKVVLIGKDKELFTQVEYYNKNYFIKQRHISAL